MKYIRLRAVLQIAVTLVLCNGITQALFAQHEDKLKTEFFKELDAAFRKARDEAIIELAPKSYSKALKLYKMAESDYAKGERIDKIRQKIKESLAGINNAILTANVSRVALSDLLLVRQEVGAKKEYIALKPKEFAAAERKYADAIKKAEDGNIKTARNKAQDAKKLYRQMMVKALLEGPVKATEQKLRKDKSLSKNERKQSKRKLKEIKKSVEAASKRMFNINDFESKTLAELDAILPSVFLEPKGPKAPNNLEVSERTETAISITWIDQSTDEKGFIVQRRKHDQTTWRQIQAVVLSGSSPNLGLSTGKQMTFRDEGLMSGEAYCYRVLAGNDNGRTASKNLYTNTVPSLSQVRKKSLNVTKGSVSETASGFLTITRPTVRAVEKSGKAKSAKLRVRYRGPTSETVPLKNGSIRRQIGLKMKAMDTCNLLYVMWEIEPKEKLKVQVKRNPGKKYHKECGTDNYFKQVPYVNQDDSSHGFPSAKDQRSHILEADLFPVGEKGYDLHIYIDGKQVWQNTIPQSLLQGIDGHAGIRTDNGSFIFKLFTGRK